MSDQIDDEFERIRDRLGQELVAAAYREYGTRDHAEADPGTGGDRETVPVVVGQVVSIEDSPPSRRRAGRPVRLVAAAAAVLIVAGAAVLVPALRGHDQATADVQVTRDGTSHITVALSKVVSVAQLSDALERAGVDVKVRGEATGPSRVNRFVGIAGPATAVDQRPDHTSSTVTFVEGSKVELDLGVPATPGQLYGVPTNPTDPGEPLVGLASPIGSAIGPQVADIERAAQAAHVTVTYLAGATKTARPAADDTRTVFQFLMMSANSVSVYLNGAS